MKKRISLLGLALCILLLAPLAAIGASPTFTDTEGHWAEDTIERFYEEGVISGFPDGSFRPDQGISRAELARIITRAFDLDEESAFTFSDVDPAAWYYGDLGFASRFIPNHQVTPGHFAGSATAFRIDALRALILVHLYTENLAIDMPTPEEIAAYVRQNFRDRDYQYGNINYPNVRILFETTWLASFLGIFEPTPEGYLNPHWGLSRAEVLTVIERMRK